MKRKKLPPDVLEFFKEAGRKGGSKGGKIGGKRSLETMTPEERKERARKAGLKSGIVRAKKAAAASAKVRAKKAAAKKKTKG